MHQVKVVWPELSILCMAATAKKPIREKATQLAISTEQKKEVFTNKLTLTHAYNPLTPLLSSHLQSHIQFSHTFSSVTQHSQQPPSVTHLQSHIISDAQPESIVV